VGLEVERKFLLPQAPDWLSDHPSKPIEQGYVVVGDEVEVRLRRAGEKHLLTVKRGHGEVREEVEIELGREQFEELWPLTESLRLKKTRHRVPLDGLTAEVDLYEGPLEGLVVAEIEFPSAQDSEGFEPPPWLGDEVTGDEGYANQSLARSGRPHGPAGRR
jgi:adenylate cyclase